jgi:hypothetical protein
MSTSRGQDEGPAVTALVTAAGAVKVNVISESSAPGTRIDESKIAR